MQKDRVDISIGGEFASGGGVDSLSTSLSRGEVARYAHMTDEEIGKLNGQVEIGVYDKEKDEYVDGMEEMAPEWAIAQACKKWYQENM